MKTIPTQIISLLTYLPTRILSALAIISALGGMTITLLITMNGPWIYLWLNGLMGIFIGGLVAASSLLYAEAIDKKDTVVRKSDPVYVKEGQMFMKIMLKSGLDTEVLMDYNWSIEVLGSHSYMIDGVHPVARRIRKRLDNIVIQ